MQSAVTSEQSLIIPEDQQAMATTITLSEDSTKNSLLYDPSELEANLKHPIKLKSEFSELSLIGGIIGGSGTFYIYENTGLETGLHEVLGHGILGLELTTDYPNGSGPTYWVSGYDQFKAIGQADSIPEKIKAFFSWLFVPPPTRNGAVGLTYHNSSGHPNNLGIAMGSPGLSAWISISGSLPGLVLDSTCVVGGMALTKKCPALGWGLVTFGLLNNFSQSFYALDAAMMSAAQMQEAASTGHDFANFAQQMSKITGLSATAIAISTTCFWMGFVPLVALSMYLYRKTHQADIVPDAVALQFWLSQLGLDPNKQKQFQELLAKYPDKGKLPFYRGQGRIISLNPAADDEEEQKILADFMNYLAKNLPKKSLRKAKEEVLRRWQALQVQSPFEKVLSYAAFASGAVSITAQIIQVLSTTIVPNLTAVAAVLHVIVPFLGLLSVIQNFYETYKDLKCPNEQVSVIAKILSCSKLALSILMTTGMLLATFVPGLQAILLPTLIVGSVLMIALSFAKFKVIQKQFQKNQAAKDVKEEENKISSPSYRFFPASSPNEKSFAPEVEAEPILAVA